MPTLHKGDRGKYVRWAQVLLNVHHAATPPLKPDEFFGPKTLEAVITFQKASSLKPDGIVGLQTWLKLQLITAELPQATPVVSSAVSIAPSAPTSPKGPISVADWSLTRRFTEVVTKLTAKHLIGKTRAEFQAMLTPFNIGFMVTTLVAWAVSHAFGAGEIADVVIAVLGIAFLGLNAFRAGYALGSCLERTFNAEVYSDLDEAGAQLAKAIAIIGVTAFFALLGKISAKLIKRAFPGKKTPPPDPNQQKAPPPEKSSDSRDPNEPDPAAARQARLQELARDPSHGGKISGKSLQEAEVGLSSEENGKIPGPITRDPSGAAEFIDGNKQPWDVKGFNSNFPPEKGGFDLATDLGKIQNEVSGGENVIVDTTKMSPADVQSLQGGVEGAGLSDNVVWYP